MARPLALVGGLGALALAFACGKQSGADAGSGGAPATGGASATGGAPATGGASGPGGTPASGGAGGTGGASATGGAGGTGGAPATGGASGTGGAPASGGASGSGGTRVCGSGAENANVTLTCPAGQTIDAIAFASFGTPTGSCGSFAVGTCNASSSVAVVSALCVGRASCTVPAANGAFTDPCDKTVKSLSIQATCTAGGGMEPPAAGQQPFKGVANSACADRGHLRVSWYYNWEQTADGCDASGGQFVPMIWGHTGSEQSAAGISGAVSSFVGKGYGYVLGFNEPDNSTQSNIPVATAVSLWPSFDNRAIKVGTPATQANTTGQSWFTTFIGDVNAGTALQADFIALHWYGWNAGSCDASAAQLESYLDWAEGFAGNRPLWLTEWGCLNDSAPDAQTVVDFYNGALAVFARHPRLQRYAWYPWSTNLALVNADGSFTALGTAFAAAPAYK